MSKNVIGARMIHRLSSVTGTVPTVPNPDTNDHTMGWKPTDIYKAEFFMNMVDDRVWTRTDYNSFTSGITEFMMVDALTGKMPSRYMLNEVDGDFLVTGELTVGSLSLPTPSSDLRAVFADSNGMLTISSIVPGQGTVRKVTTSYGLVCSPSTGITDMGNIELGLPHSIHSGSTNGFVNNTGHTHQFIPAGNTNEIQLNSGGTLGSSSNFKFDGNDLYVTSMTSSGTSYVVCYNPLDGRITYNSGSVVAAGNTTEIQYNSGGTMYASSNFKYDGTDLYLSNITNSGTSYGLYYNEITGRITYSAITFGTVSAVKAGDGMDFSDITSNGYVTMGIPTGITSTSDNVLFTNSHTHKFEAAVGVLGSVQLMTSTSGITGNSNFKYLSTGLSGLYLLGMASSGTSSGVCYNSSTGRLTYGPNSSGTVTTISAGSGMSFTTIVDSGTINMGIPNDITSSSINDATIGGGHSHAFIPAGSNTNIQINSGGTLYASSNFYYNGTDLYVSGMTLSGTSYVVYYDDISGQFTYGSKPSGTGIGGSNMSVQYNSGDTFTGNNNFIYDGKDLYISGMTSGATTEVVYYDSVTGQLTYGQKPISGSLSGSTPFNMGTNQVIDSYPMSNKFCVYHYCIYSGETNSRAGTVEIVNNSTTTRITESSTQDIGDTSNPTGNKVSFTSGINGSNIELRVDSLTDGWICDWIKITK